MFLNRVRGHLLACSSSLFRSPRALLCTGQQQGGCKDVLDDVFGSDMKGSTDTSQSASLSGFEGKESVDNQEKADYTVETSSSPELFSALAFFGLEEKDLDNMTEDQYMLHMKEKLAEMMKRELLEDNLSEERKKHLRHELHLTNTELVFEKKFGWRMDSIV